MLTEKRLIMLTEKRLIMLTEKRQKAVPRRGADYEKSRQLSAAVRQHN